MTAIISISSDGISAGLTKCSLVPDSAAISGRVSLTDPDGRVNTFGPGESCIMPVGWQGRFEVIETLRKIYVITNA